ncbi:rod shape-determining protein MreC [Flavivirga eckloniae]|uniref:Cell shape-determining protein MreC n=1 Tax=Flavivirga eckloniae TaxID=1803846 RepID=A0A2K9PNY8_9FLAO|nr:rod shape-determining protein MreC [Flavivirga eckloniae]AUP78762.1 rod shape-determining protein MreC [Flavivirga eckloniae]
MQQIINFIIRNKNFLLFLLLFSISILFTIQSHSYHRSKFINSANFLSGSILNTANSISTYFNLKSQNTLLSEENKRLKSLLYNLKNSTTTQDTDSLKPYYFSNARVIRNNYSATDNYLLINKGTNDSIKQDFGVVTTHGIVGIVDKTSGNYATVVSILNTTSSISSQLKKTNHYGTLTWDAKNPAVVQLTDIPKIANVLVGDTIVTSGRSSIFPKDIEIGTVKNYKLDAAENYYEINVQLFNDMTNLEHVYIIENINKPEVTNLLNE